MSDTCYPALTGTKPPTDGSFTDMNETFKSLFKILGKITISGTPNRGALNLVFPRKNFIRRGRHDNLFGRRQYPFRNWWLGV